MEAFIKHLCGWWVGERGSYKFSRAMIVLAFTVTTKFVPDGSQGLNNSELNSNFTKPTSSQKDL